MFEGKSLWEIFNMGGFTMYVLLLCSVISLGVIFERMLHYRKKSRTDRITFMKRVRDEIERGNVEAALRLAEREDTPIGAVVLAGLKKHRNEEKVIASAMEREILIETGKLERHTSVVGTIGNIAVYIGLFGTVLGIVHSFSDISKLGSGGMSVVIGGVSEALICTATGLSVAIPAVVAYNYFMKRVDRFVADMEYCSSETVDILTVRKPS